MVSAIVAAFGALKGPLHGGAPGLVLEMLDAVGEPERAAAWLAGQLRAGRRIMGMGHRVYRVRNPRAAVLEKAVECLERAGSPAPDCGWLGRSREPPRSCWKDATRIGRCARASSSTRSSVGGGRAAPRGVHGHLCRRARRGVVRPRRRAKTGRPPDQLRERELGGSGVTPPPAPCQPDVPAARLTREWSRGPGCRSRLVGEAHPGAQSRRFAAVKVDPLTTVHADAVAEAVREAPLPGARSSPPR